MKRFYRKSQSQLRMHNRMAKPKLVKPSYYVVLYQTPNKLAVNIVSDLEKLKALQRQFRVLRVLTAKTYEQASRVRNRLINTKQNYCK